ncbi:response regulator transcription factor [Streptomyces sp. NPDC005811]|uniref:response regulator transcription factor n=1 Tax=Streptomyces sp. NPDC005811 TaxID=3154565 RepID=UPI0033D91078
MGLAQGGSRDETACRPQRVLVVDERELVQAGLRAVLAGESWVGACLGASSADMAWELARRHHPQLLLLSMSVQGCSGLELCRQFKQRMPHIKVMLMSGEGRVSTSLATSNGAVGFLPTDMPAAGIVSIVRRVAEGGKVFPRNPDPPENARLSKRELDVLKHLVSGLSNPEMAELLSLSRHTVKQHTSTVYRKLGVRNRAQAASRAQELGLVG